MLCDVDNPLFGKTGAAHIYAPQKGADEATVDLLDKGLQHFSRLLEGHFGRDFALIPGAGAAGGLGAGAMGFLGAQLRPGIDAVMDFTRFKERLEGQNLVITGEGKIDQQTLHGKLIYGITQKAAVENVPVIALCGTLFASPDDVSAIGLKAAYSILNRPMSLEEALKETASLLENTAFNIGGTMAWDKP